MKNAGVVLLFGLLLAGCSSTAIYLKNAAGQVATCGPFDETTEAARIAAAQREARCISDYQRQGYERAPSP